MVKATTKSKKSGRGELTLEWGYEQCAARMESAFSRLTRRIDKAGAGTVILDMSSCQYVSVEGMNLLLEWYLSVARDGIKVRIKGLKPMFRKLFVMSKLDWILAE